MAGCRATSTASSTRPRDLRLALIEAADRKIGSPVDQLLLACFHYDPKSGKYSLAIMRLVQTAGVLTVVAIGLTILILRRRDRAPLSHGAHA